MDLIKTNRSHIIAKQIGIVITICATTFISLHANDNTLRLGVQFSEPLMSPCGTDYKIMVYIINKYSPAINELRPGDFLTSVNGEKISSFEQAMSLIKNATSDIELRIYRPIINIKPGESEYKTVNLKKVKSSYLYNDILCDTVNINNQLYRDLWKDKYKTIIDNIPIEIHSKLNAKIMSIKKDTILLKGICQRGSVQGMKDVLLPLKSYSLILTTDTVKISYREIVFHPQVMNYPIEKGKSISFLAMSAKDISIVNTTVYNNTDSIEDIPETMLNIVLQLKNTSSNFYQEFITTKNEYDDLDKEHISSLLANIGKIDSADIPEKNRNKDISVAYPYIRVNSIYKYVDSLAGNFNVPTRDSILNVLNKKAVETVENMLKKDFVTINKIKDMTDRINRLGFIISAYEKLIRDIIIPESSQIANLISEYENEISNLENTLLTYAKGPNWLVKKDNESGEFHIEIRAKSITALKTAFWASTKSLLELSKKHNVQYTWYSYVTIQPKQSLIANDNRSVRFEFGLIAYDKYGREIKQGKSSVEVCLSTDDVFTVDIDLSSLIGGIYCD
ncbi:MAG: PDZ domain-containing protein [Fibrobacteres bacterium]|nr:PDZ domain-containing protein [Fibrobacterota bacterium]